MTNWEIGENLGCGRVAEVFAHGGNVIKLYRAGRGKEEAFREAATLAILQSTGLPIPSVVSVGQYKDRWGIEMSRAPQRTVAFDTGSQVSAMAGLHHRIHQVRSRTLPGQKKRLRENIERATQLTSRERVRLLSLLEDLPDDDQLCHGDFHPGNIMGDMSKPFVVDWLDATSGSAQADVCRTYLLALHNAPALADVYLAEYCHASGYPAEPILAWLPVVAAARLVEDIPEEVPRLLALAGAEV